MEFQLKKQTLVCDEPFREISSEQSLEKEITLPDYCGDIKKILKCAVSVGITNVSLSGEKATLTGRADIRFIYVNDKDKLDCCESQESLNVTALIKDLPENPLLCAVAKPDYVNCRATSQRKITLEGSIAVIFRLYSQGRQELAQTAEGKGVQCLKRSVSYEELICRKEKMFELGETARVPQDKAAVGKILNVSARAVLESKKAVSDKLLIKGEVYTEVLYLSESREGTLESFSHSMPVSQIIDVPGIDEKSLCSVALQVKHIEVQRKADSSSQGSLLEIGVGCSALVKCSEIKSTEVTEDCYSVSHDLESSYTVCELSLPVYSADEQKTVTADIDMPSDFSELLDIRCSDITGKMKGRDNKTQAVCSALLSIFYKDRGGVPAYCERNADFTLDCRLRESYENLRCDFHIQPGDVEYKPGNKPGIKMRVGIVCDVYACESVRAMKDVKLSGEKKNADEAALTLYFAQKDEKIWDIAKKYNTTAEAVKKENALQGDATEKQGMILIPCAM